LAAPPASSEALLAVGCGAYLFRIAIPRAPRPPTRRQSRYRGVGAFLLSALRWSQGGEAIFSTPLNRR
jgi:hypothetical protein